MDEGEYLPQRSPLALVQGGEDSNCLVLIGVVVCSIVPHSPHITWSVEVNEVQLL